MTDAGGGESRRFGALTSGHVLLYGRDGRLLYNGGVTGGRGHEGANAGLSLAEKLLRSGGEPASQPIYGCALNDPRDCQVQGEHTCALTTSSS